MLYCLLDLKVKKEKSGKEALCLGSKILSPSDAKGAVEAKLSSACSACGGLSNRDSLHRRDFGFTLKLVAHVALLWSLVELIGFETVPGIDDEFQVIGFFSIKEDWCSHASLFISYRNITSK